MNVQKFIQGNMLMYPNFPKEGIDFFDLNPILSDPFKLNNLISELYIKAANLDFDYSFDKVVAVESRGFLYGLPVAKNLCVGFVPVRKPGKLPGDVCSVSYSLEYGKDVLQIQKESIKEGDRCLIVDDVLATGGTLKATKQLVESCGGIVSAALVVMRLKSFFLPSELCGLKIESLCDM